MRNTTISVLSLALAAACLATPVAAKQPPTKQPHCYDVQVERPKEVKDEHKITGTALGAVAGGLLGNQVGGGSGKKIATAAGAVGGAFAGRKIQDNQQNKTETVTERRCD
ncbi:glycine zipper 2TM domain-containing protein [Lysobacter panacisoli]|uniref:Glycine zipper 2TM domain-containing protein n=1 Tax=Lysobacter panacisoli TaxID=1255263 RepID=A0ABP9LBR1_9GAMM|nr:glycine zipper 2TM domain-containing protein [Lysobacter panacisoli]